MSWIVAETTGMAGAGFEPAKAEPRDLQSRPFDRSGIPPGAAESSDETRRTNRQTRTRSRSVVLRTTEPEPARASDLGRTG